MADPATPRVMTVREAAHALGLSEYQVRNRIRRGVLPAVKILGALRIPIEDVERARQGTPSGDNAQPGVEPDTSPNQERGHRTDVQYPPHTR